MQVISGNGVKVCTYEYCFNNVVGESSIGRVSECDLTIEAVSLSRKHAIILVERGTHFVMDNGSRNKTLRGEVSREEGG